MVTDKAASPEFLAKLNHPENGRAMRELIAGLGLAPAVLEWMYRNIGAVNGLPELVEGAKLALPHLRDVVSRGQVEGEDTSHYSDARAVKLLEHGLRAGGGA